MEPKTPTPVTVVIPCYNEEAGLPWLLSRLEAMRKGEAATWKFLFVDDGSTDGTFAKLLHSAADADWMEVVRHPENLGLGAAIRTGFEQARSPIVCTMDSDCTYPPERLPELARLASQGTAIVTASAWHPDSAEAEGSSYRLALSRFVSVLYKALIGQDVHTFTCLFRAYRREVIERIPFRSNGFAAVAEILIRALLFGFPVAEVPMQLEKRQFGESKMRVSDAVMAHVRLLSLTAVLVAFQYVRIAASRPRR